MKLNIHFVSIKIILALVLFTPTILNSQTVSEKIGGISTNFIIKSDSIVLNNDRQILIRRGVKSYDKDLVMEIAYGYGFQTYHLEFISNNEIQHNKKQRTRIKNQQPYKIYLTNKDGLKFYNVELSNSDVNQVVGFRGNQKIYAYSINLNNIPIILFDEIDEIEIIKIKK